MLLHIFLAIYAISINTETVRCMPHHENAHSAASHFPCAFGDFKNLRSRDDRLFVDKSLFIKEVVESDEKFMIISRPPRFGKSVNLNMLERFFKIPDDEHEAQINRHLFLGGEIPANGQNKTLSKLHIADHPEIIDEHLGTHPVISLSFRNCNCTNVYEVKKSVADKIVNFYRQRKHLQDYFEREKIHVFDDHDHSHHTNYEPEKYLKSLIKHARGYYTKKVIVLINDYDFAMNEALLSLGAGNKEFRKINYFFDSLLNELDPTNNKNVQRIIITSLMPFKEESESVSVHHVLKNKFSTYFGLTEQEVHHLFGVFNPSSSEQGDIEDYYWRYTIDEHTIYDSESILKCLKNGGAVHKYSEIDKNLRIIDQTPIESKTVGVIDHFLHEVDKNFYYSPIQFIKVKSIDDIDLYDYLVHAGILHFQSQAGTVTLETSDHNSQTKLMLKRKINHWVTTKLKLNNTENLLDHLTKLDLHDFHEQVENIIHKATAQRLYSGHQEYYGFMLEGLITRGMDCDCHSDSDFEYANERFLVSFAHRSKRGCVSGVIMAIKMAYGNDTDSLTTDAAEGLDDIIDNDYKSDLLKKHPHVQYVVKLGLAYRDGLLGMKCQVEKIKTDSPNTCDGVRIDSITTTKPHEIQITSTHAMSSTTKRIQSSSHPPTTSTKRKKVHTTKATTLDPVIASDKSNRFKIFIKSKLPALSDISLQETENQLHSGEHNREVFKRYLSSKGIMHGLNQTIHHLQAAIIHPNIRISKKSNESGASFSDKYKFIINAVVDVLHHSYEDTGDKSTLKAVRRSFNQLNLYGESSRTTANEESSDHDETTESYSQQTSHEYDESHYHSHDSSDNESSEQSYSENEETDDGSYHDSSQSESSDTSDSESSDTSDSESSDTSDSGSTSDE